MYIITTNWWILVKFVVENLWTYGAWTISKSTFRSKLSHEPHASRNPNQSSMDSPIISRLFRQLFSHQRCQSTRSHSALPFRINNGRRPQIRYLSSGGDGAEKRRNEANWQQRSDIFPYDMSEEFKSYPMLTADQLRGRKERPRRVKMLTRDFIEGMFSLNEC